MILELHLSKEPPLLKTLDATELLVLRLCRY